MARKSKYTDEIVEAIYRSLETHCSDTIASKEVGISLTTYYHWQRKFPQFSQGVARAKQRFRENLPVEQLVQAKRAFADYLFGRVEERWKIIENTFDAEGRPIKIETTKVVRRGIPKWAIERVLGRPAPGMDIVNAFSCLAENDILAPEASEIAQSIVSQANKSFGKLLNQQESDADFVETIHRLVQNQTLNPSVLEEMKGIKRLDLEGMIDLINRYRKIE